MSQDVSLKQFISRSWPIGALVFIVVAGVENQTWAIKILVTVWSMVCHGVGYQQGRESAYKDDD